MDNIIQLNGSKDIVDIIKAKIGGQFILGYVSEETDDRDVIVYISNDLSGPDSSWIIKVMDTMLADKITTCHVEH